MNYLSIIIYLLTANIAQVHCPSDMIFVDVNKSFCIDKYEAPNKEGENPLHGLNYLMAESYCASVGKQVCSAEQWTNACSGTQKYKFPYGNNYKRGTCNDDKTNYIHVSWEKMSTMEWPSIVDKLYKGEVSGARNDCVSDYGVYDMTGNVAEIVSSSNSPHGMVVKGCFWYGCLYNIQPTCGFENRAHNKSFRSYEFGTRCCSEPSVGN